MSPALHTTYLGLTLRSPVVASAGPFTRDLGRIEELAAAGVGAIVLPSLFEEQIEHEALELDRLFTLHDESFAEATSVLPDVVGGADDLIDDYLDLIGEARHRARVPVIASLNGTHPGGWLSYARVLEDAGADAIELNLYEIAADPAIDAAAIERDQLEIVSTVAAALHVPLAVKISPYYTSVANFAVRLQEAGADGVVMFNRFYLPDLDLETLDVVPRLALSTPDELRLPLRWIGVAREHLHVSLAGSSGVHGGTDVAKLILAGANVAMTTSAVLRHGPAHVERMLAELETWMVEHGYESVDEMRGAVRRDAAADPEAYERANYIGTLATYTSRFLARS